MALGLLAWALALCLPALVLGNHAVLGAAGSDAIRGVWSMDHILRGLPDPIWTERIHAPGGAFALPLPFASSLLLAPVLALLGPFAGYSVACALLLGLDGLGVAWLGRELSGRWAVGALAGGAFMVQPMLLHAIEDGTPEHLAFWSLPVALALAARALRLRHRGSALASGLLLGCVLFDSPYLAVQALVAAPAALLALLLRARADGRPLRDLLVLAWVLPTALPILGFVQWLYSGFSLSLPSSVHDPITVLAGNSVDLKSWWILDRAPERDLLGNMAPAFIPSAFLLPAALLALLALPRSLPWLLAALLAGILALGTNLGNPHILTLWGGVHLGAAGSRAGNALGDAILGFNQALSGWPVFDGIRFPRRWLVCSGLALSLAGSLGVQSGFRLLGRLPLLRRVAAELPRSHPRVATLAGILGAMLLATLLLPLGRTRGFPSVTPLPRVEFAEWLRGQGQGAVLQLPTQRPAPGQGFRASVPVYAGLPDVLASADAEYFQILHRHPTRHHPSLLTVRPVRPLPEKLLGFLRDLDDLALPRLQGLQPPLSATEQKRSGERRALRDSLVKAGFRWASVDLSAYEEPWLGILLEHLSPIADQRRFADGAGVLVLELGD